MRWILSVFLVLVCASSFLMFSNADKNALKPAPAEARSYLGFDRNEYPGDETLPVLRKSFAFASYWLSAPPGEKANSWTRKRSLLESHGFGFLLLFNGRTAAQVRTAQLAEAAGLADARSAAAAARSEGFPKGSVIFLDEEDGGRFSEEQHLYLHTWAAELERQEFRAGIYCSGIPVDEGGGSHVVTAKDIQAHIADPEVVYWVYNDACPPSTGCEVAEKLPAPSGSGIAYAEVWQFVRSPREKKATRHCRGYASDGNCYAPVDKSRQWFLDMDVATTANPSAPH
jgi:Domain of unknown function (DUF1906)